MKFHHKVSFNLGSKTLSQLHAIVDLALDRILGPVPQPNGRLTLRFIPGGPTITGDIKMFKLGDTNKVKFRLQPLDAAGNPVTADLIESIIFASSDPGVLLLGSDPDSPSDPLAGEASAVGPLGTAQLQWAFDAHLGEGVTTISGFVDVEVVPTEAVGAGVSFGDQLPR